PGRFRSPSRALKLRAMGWARETGAETSFVSFFLGRIESRQSTRKQKVLRLRSPALEKTRGNPPALRTLDIEKWIHQLRNRRSHGSKNWKTNYLCVLRALRVHPGFWGYCSMPCWATAILSRVEFLTMYIISSA